MNPHLLFCSDLSTRDDAGDRIRRVQGWCIASPPICSLFVENPSSGFERISTGVERSDIGRLYSAYGTPSKAGFLFSGDLPIKGDELARLAVEIGEQGQDRQYHLVGVRLDTRDIQTIELNEETRASAEQSGVKAAIAPASDVETRLRRSLKARRGLSLRLDIINKCNLRCVMCHFSDETIFRRPTSQISTQDFQTLFEQIAPNVKNVILSCGDEPLTSKHFVEILQYLAGNHPEVEIEFCTNATLMRAPMRKAIVETGVSRILLSLDAVSKQLLESIRVGCRYEQVLGNIMALRDLKLASGSGRPEFVFNFVMMNRNVHEAPAFVHMASALGAELVDFRHMVPIATYFDPADVLESVPAKYNYFRARITEEASKLGLAYFLPPLFETTQQWEPSDRIDIDLTDFHEVVADPVGQHQLRLPVRPVKASPNGGGLSAAEEFAGTFCPRPFSEIMVRDQDEVLPCPWHGKVLGHLKEGQSLSEIFFGENFRRLRQNMLKPEGDPDCARCPIKSGHLSSSC